MSIFSAQFAAAKARLELDASAQASTDATASTEELGLESLTAEFDEIEQILAATDAEIVNVEKDEDGNIPGDKNEDVEGKPAEAATEGLDRPTGENIGDDITVVPPAGVPEVDGDKVNDDKDSGDVDYEEADVTAEEEMVLEEVLSEVAGLESLEDEISMVSESAIAIECFGITPTTGIVMKTTGLLAGTALDAIAIENWGMYAPEDEESQMAVESLVDKVKTKAAEWGAKILSLAKGFGDKIMGVLAPLWEKLSGAIKHAASVVEEKVKAGVEYAKANPMKTLVGVVLAIAAVAGVITFAAGKMPTGSAISGKMGEWLAAIGAKIEGLKTPLGKFTTSIQRGGKKLGIKFIRAQRAVTKGTLSALGWSKAAIVDLGAKLARSWSQLVTSVKAFGTKAGTMAKSGSAWAASSAGALKNTAKEVATTGYGKAKAAGAATADAAKSFGGKVKGAAETAVDAAKSAKELGKATVDGAAMGARDKVGDLYGSKVGFGAGVAVMAIMASGVAAIVSVVIRVVVAGFRFIYDSIKSLFGSAKTEEAAA